MNEKDVSMESGDVFGGEDVVMSDESLAETFIENLEEGEESDQDMIYNNICGDNGLTPEDVVNQLDKHIIGQNDAKKAIAIAMRNRWRRANIVGDLKDEVIPKNILMIGPTGVGKLR